MEVTQPQAHVEPYGDPIIEDTDGNLDGLVNPNENGNITFTLRNWGSMASNNIEATLTAENTDEVEIISTNPINYGNLAAGADFTGSPFQFFVNPICSVGQSVTLLLHVTSSTDNWDYEIDVKIHGCELNMNNFLVNDESSSDVNYRMDPGETVKLVLSIDNFGNDIAPEIIGLLSSADQYITIEDPNGSFGTLGINEVAINTDDFFIVSIDPSCPTGYLAEFTLELNTQNGNYAYQIISDFSLPVSLPISTDYTGPDAYGYYAYSNNDAFYDQTPVYNWVEIDQVGTEINPNYNSDYTETQSLPFTFKYYGLDYNQVRISTDGWIAFGSGTQAAPENSALPANDNVNNMLAVFWDDLYDLDLMQEGKILYYNDNTNHRYIIEWDSIALNINGPVPIKETFQAILLDPAYYPTTSGDGEIIFQYKTIALVDSMTIGIENNLQDIGLQYVHNDVYDATASELENGVAIKFTTEPPFYNLITEVQDNITQLPNGFDLRQNHPNPFSSNTWINYSLPVSSNVLLAIYNVNGELVRTLHNGQQSAGTYSVVWNGLNNNRERVSPGIYFYRLHTEKYLKTLKLLLLK